MKESGNYLSGSGDALCVCACVCDDTAWDKQGREGRGHRRDEGARQQEDTQVGQEKQYKRLGWQGGYGGVGRQWARCWQKEKKILHEFTHRTVSIYSLYALSI